MMKSETRDEAVARMKAMSADEKEGMRKSQEGTLAVPPGNEETDRRARHVDEVGEAQHAATQRMSVDAVTTSNVVAPADERPAKAAASGGHKSYQTK